MTENVNGRPKKYSRDLARSWRYIVIAMVIVWTGTIGGSLIWNLHLADRQFAALAHKEAVANYDKDQGFRLWGNKHGGVYVPITEETPPSPWLSHIPERDIETPSGRKLTLMNPAYMVRQLMDDYAELYGVRGRITGLKVLRQGNAPDDWEKQALLKLKNGATQVHADTLIDGVPYHRMMRPVYMVPGCEKCHARLGFKLGDFRGGVGVSVPLTPYINAQQSGAEMLSLTHGVIWLLGLSAIVLCARVVRSRIAERDEADEKIKAQTARFETLLDMAPDAFLVMDESGHVSLFSRGASDIFGYAPGEVLGQQIELLLPGVQVGDETLPVSSFSAGGQQNHQAQIGVETTARRKDGSAFLAETSVAGLNLAGESLVTATVRDITERKKQEEVIRRSQRMDAIGHLTGGVAHDFNNLLAIVLGNLSLLDSELPADSELRSLTGPAMLAVERGASLTQRLLAFAKRQTLQVSVIDVGELLTGLREMLQRTLGEDIDVVFRIESGLWSCKVDAGQLEQAVINLANNARDAMPLGGRLLLEVSNDSVDEEKAAQVEGANPGDYVTISITDDGSGISPEAMQQIFEPFFTTKPTASGTGLGLSMVYGFVSQSSGHIVVDSTVGKGTRISFSLPRHRSEPVEPQPSAGALTVGAGEVVLIVDDDPDVCEMVRRVVSNLGYSSLTARTGGEALDVLRQQGSVDLLLADVILAGGMSGVDLATEALQIFPRLKVLYMSGYAGDELARRIEVGDEVALIQKPFRPEELGNYLREVLSD